MIGLGLLSVVALIACGDDDDESDVAEANTAFCEDLAAYGVAVGDLAALDPATASKDDYESAADDVRSTRDDMVDSAADLSEAEWQNVQTQADTLDDQLQDAPDDQAVQSVLEERKRQAATVQASVATLNTAICTIGSATTRQAADRSSRVCTTSRTCVDRPRSGQSAAGTCRAPRGEEPDARLGHFDQLNRDLEIRDLYNLEDPSGRPAFEGADHGPNDLKPIGATPARTMTLAPSRPGGRSSPAEAPGRSASQLMSSRARTALSVLSVLSGRGDDDDLPTVESSR